MELHKNDEISLRKYCLVKDKENERKTNKRYECEPNQIVQLANLNPLKHNSGTCNHRTEHSNQFPAGLFQLRLSYKVHELLDHYQLVIYVGNHLTKITKKIRK